MTARTWGSVLDVPGVRVGQAERVDGGALTGVTVVVPPPGTVGGVDVRGGGPGTHETDALAPTTLVPTVDAVVLTGGSAYGLVAAHGVQRTLERAGRGFTVGMRDAATPLVVPIVPAAAVFDLGRGGDPDARPDADLGALAAREALGRNEIEPLRRGVAGAGAGALCAGGALKGGTGTASLRLSGLGTDGADVVVGAVAVVNAVGSPADPVSGALYGAAFVPSGLPRPGAPSPPESAALRDLLAETAARRAAAPGPAPGTATTLAVVVTNAALDPGRTNRTATAAHAGLARALDPVHTLLDGDTVFALSTQTVQVPDTALLAVQAAAATVVMLAVMDGVLAATATRTPSIDVPGYLDVCPSVAASLR